MTVAVCLETLRLRFPEPVSGRPRLLWETILMEGFCPLPHDDGKRGEPTWIATPRGVEALGRLDDTLQMSETITSLLATLLKILTLDDSSIVLQWLHSSR